MKVVESSRVELLYVDAIISGHISYDSQRFTSGMRITVFPKYNFGSSMCSVCIGNDLPSRT
jgi:hypothetical protein